MRFYHTTARNALILEWDAHLEILESPLGTVAVATAVVADLDVTAVVALIHVPAKGIGATLLDGRHGLALLGAEGVRGAVVVPVLAKYVGDLIADLGPFGREFPGDLVACCRPDVHGRRVVAIPRIMGFAMRLFANVFNGSLPGILRASFLLSLCHIP